MKRALLLVALLLMTVAIGAAAVGQTEETATFLFQGVERRYVLHRGTNGSSPSPVVVALHGLNESVEGLRRSWTMDVVSDREGFNVLYPEALAGRWAYADSRPVNIPGSNGLIDDVGFIGALLDKLIEDRVADAARIYIVGTSNGGLMAWTLACQMADRIAGVAPMISGMIERQVEQCHPKRLVPLMVVAGTDDWVQAYDGAMAPNFRLLSVPESLEYWRRLRGCAGLDFHEVAPHEPSDPTTAVLVEWKNCKDPSPQRFYRIEGGGHSLPSFRSLSDHEKRRHGGRSQTIETAEVLWSFFRGSAR